MINTQEIMRQAEANLTADSVVLCVKYEAQNPGGPGMDDRQKELLKALADALERAGAAARELVEYEPDPVTLKVDAAGMGQLIRALYRPKTEPRP